MPEHGRAYRRGQSGTGASLTTDAQSVAFAPEFGGTIHSDDSDFGRFPGVRWENRPA